MAMVSSERYINLSRVPSRDRQLHSRPRVTPPSVISRMEAEQAGLLPCDEDNGDVQHRPVCDTLKPPADTVCQLETGSLRHSHRCNDTQLERQRSICLSTILPDREVLTESGGGEGNTDTHSTSMEHSAMVPSSPGSINCSPPSPAAETRSLNRPLQSILPTERPAVSRLENIRRQHSNLGLSEEASNLIQAGWSKGTNTAYQSAWSKWVSWCDQRKDDPLRCRIQSFVDFLADCFQKGLQHRTINLLRSAVSMTHEHVEGIPLGQHPLVSRLMKGVSNSRPPCPRYTSTWDVDMVLKYIINLGENKDLSLKTLSKKLALLMALTDASRCSELHALDLRFRVSKPEGVFFTLASLTKKRKAGEMPKALFFGAFPEDTRLCVLHCLQQYEKLTKRFRSADNDPKPLFLSYIKPHGPVTVQRIAHWIKDMLGEAGVDTSTFKAHSVRGATTSAALAKGVSIEEILKIADWSSDTTFRRFYYRPSRDNVFSRTVLQLSK